MVPSGHGHGVKDSGIICVYPRSSAAKNIFIIFLILFFVFFVVKSLPKYRGYRSDNGQRFSRAPPPAHARLLYRAREKIPGTCPNKFEHGTPDHEFEHGTPDRARKFRRGGFETRP